MYYVYIDIFFKFIMIGKSIDRSVTPLEYNKYIRARV